MSDFQIDSEDPSRKVLETLVEEADEDTSDTISEDPDHIFKATKKPIVIKAVKSSKVTERKFFFETFIVADGFQTPSCRFPPAIYRTP